MNKEFYEKFKINQLVLFETMHWVVSVRPKQVTIGSLVITLKRSCKYLGEINKVETEELSTVFYKTEMLLKDTFSNDKINYMALMMVDDQVHFHVFPRYKEFVSINNEKFIDHSWPGPIDINQSLNSKDLSSNIKSKLKNQLKDNKTIVGYTTGVFDLFHIGHLNILKNAKNNCDKLIVGVTADELSLKEKGKVPIIPLEERMEIIKNLSFIDVVVKQTTMDKFSAWEKYKFNRMFVGSDWEGTNKWINIEKKFNEIGVDIIYFPYTKSTSSTLIKELINKRI